MPIIHFLPDDKLVGSDPSETILEAALRAGIPHAHDCGGRARCSTCRVLILEGLEHCSQRTGPEEQMARQLRFCPEIRLACQTKVSGDVKLRRIVLDDDDLELTSQLRAHAAPGAIGEEKQLAILFADIEGFTHFAEQLPPYDVVHVLNRYFHKMGRIINDRGGYIDNYMGDGLLALFGLGDEPEPALRAVQAGLEMIRAAGEFEPYLKAIYSTSGFSIRVGIHFGDVVVGAIGSASRKRITAIGDAVNVASRIEEANKASGTHLLISEAVYAQVKDRVVIGRTFRTELRGKSGQFNLYEVTGLIQSNGDG